MSTEPATTSRPRDSRTGTSDQQRLDVPTLASVGLRRLSYARQMSWAMTAAFALSAAHTAYSWAVGVANPEFTVTTPGAWAFYGAGFTLAALARSPRRWVQVLVVATVVAILGVSIFYYPTTMGDHQMSAFDWFEGDLYVALLVVATWLGVLRLDRVTSTPDA